MLEIHGQNIEIHFEIEVETHCPYEKWYQASLGAPDTSVEFQRVNSQICVAMMVLHQFMLRK